MISSQTPPHTGQGYTVAVIDTGWSNSILHKGDIIYQYDFAEEDRDARDVTGFSHGGAVASVVAESLPDIDIIHLKVFSDWDETSSYEFIEAALQWSLDHQTLYNIAAVNISLGFGRTDQSVESPLSDEIKSLYDSNVAVTISSGNLGGEGINVMAATEGAIAVGSVDDQDRLSDFSQYDTDLVDAYALGENVDITYWTGSTTSLEGTSFSSPLVAASFVASNETMQSVMGCDLSVDLFLTLLDQTGQLVQELPNASNHARILDQDAIDQAIITASQKDENPHAPLQIFFNEDWYRETYDDIANAIDSGHLVSGESHYNQFGWKEGRDPSPLFDTDYYIAGNADIAAANINPFTHYNDYGAQELRSPKQDLFQAEMIIGTEFL